MKKVIKIIGLVFAVIIALMIILPMLFKGEIEQLIKDEANKRVNATIDFKDVGLNLFSSFPNFSLSVNELSIVNAKPFDGDTLLRAESFQATIHLMSLIAGDKIKINSVSFNEPQMLLFVLKDGTTNYNIMKESAEVAKDAGDEIKDTTDSSFNVELESYSISNGKIAFVDQREGMIIAVNNLNHKGSGEFSKDDFIINTQTTIDELTYEFGGVNYLNRVNAELDMQLHANIPNFKFTLKDNQLRLNNLLLKFNGSISMAKDDLELDLTFASARTEFKDIVSLIPAVYAKDFEDIESSGKMELIGNVKGISSEENIPAFNISLNVAEGKFKYPDLPMPVNNFNVNLKISNKGGEIDNTIVDLKKLHFELGKDPFDLRLLLKKPESGPYVEAKMKGTIDLANIKNALVLEDIERLEGIIKADMETKGNIFSKEIKNYEEIDAKGEVTFKNIVYKSNNLPEQVNISSASLTLTPKYFELKKMVMNIGESDINAEGSLRNLVPYTLGNGTLVGYLKVSSKYLNVNPFITKNSESAEETKGQSEDQIEAIEIPGNLDLTLDASFSSLKYDNLNMKNTKGKILIKDKKLTLDNLRMNLLGGSMIANGLYEKKDEDSKPAISFDITVNNFNVKETYDSFASVAMFAPITKYILGDFSGKLQLTSDLDGNLMPNWNSFNSEGKLSLKSAEIKGFKPFTILGSMLNVDELSNPKLTDVNPKYKITNGRFYLSPISYKIKDYDITLVGSNGIDKSLNYVMEIGIPAGELKNQANNAISSLLGKNVNVITSDKIKVNAKINGTIDSPDISTSAEDVASDVAGSAIKQAEAEARKQAEAYADSLKKEAEKKLAEETEKQKQELKKKLDDEAKSLLKNLFKKK